MCEYKIKFNKTCKTWDVLGIWGDTIFTCETRSEANKLKKQLQNNCY